MIECIHTNSKCYKQKGNYKGYPVTPKGIVVHSTGANNPWLKRYCQPSKDDPNYDDIIAVIGYNKNGNSWNRDVNKAVHYMVGKDASGNVNTAHLMPHEIPAWGVGKGKKGSYNYNPAYIQFEICEDNLTNEAYFNECMNEAINLCAMLCKANGWNSSVIVSHKEAHKQGYASNHGDPEHWMKKYDKTMAWFKERVEDKLNTPYLVSCKAKSHSEAVLISQILKINGYNCEIAPLIN